MEPYAVVETGGKQYLVRSKDKIQVEHLSGTVGEKVTIEKVLAVSDGKQTTIGTPTVPGAKVTAEIVSHIRGKKVISFRKKRRKGYQRKKGHRQELTVLRICDISSN